jgi:hypothetical protein
MNVRVSQYDGYFFLTDRLNQSSELQRFVCHTLGSSCLYVKFIQHTAYTIKRTHALLVRNLNTVPIILCIIFLLYHEYGAWGGVVVKALRY